jgi:penicillin-binding protein 1A
MGGPLSRAVGALERRAPWLGRALGPWHRHRWLRWLTGTAFALVAIAFVAFNVLWFTVELPEEPPRPQSSLILSADGEELAAIAPEGLRFDVSLEEIAPVAVRAVLSAEDRRFYEHGGIDPVGVGRAVWRNLRGSRQGGSTITQQLVKNDYLTSERSLWRKVREGILAVKLDRTADKDEILERYLNTVYFGRNAYGIEAAARAYFDIGAAELDAGQAALLAGLIRAPEAADPDDAPEVATRRRDSVLAAMARDEVITRAEAEAAAAAPIAAVPAVRAEIEAKAAPHFVELVREQAIAAVGESRANAAGLRIFTTLDIADQQAAETAVAEVLAGQQPQAALVALDTDGAIRAYVGGRDFDTLKVDLARGIEGGGTGRQPGSTFKPFVLAAALDAEVTLGQRFSAPPHIDLDIGGEVWGVDNYANESFGTVDLVAATAQSVNTVYAQLLQRVGPDAVAETANRFGVSAELDPVPAIALGSAEVSPLDMAHAFSTLANDGQRTAPYAIDRIEDADGRTVWTPDREEPERVVDEGISRAVTHALRQVITDGTGTAADIGRPAAGKTGTTQENVDAWFAGYVPGYTAVVWLGNPEGAIPIAESSGRPITGGGLPARIWQRFMSEATADREAADFPPPPPELLEAPPAPTLVIEPAEVTPGQSITVRGEGFEMCQASWFVQLDGTDVASPPETGSTSGTRQATLQLPPEDAVEGEGEGEGEGAPSPAQIRVVAICDDGTGPTPVAEATAGVAGATTTTSSTSSSSTTSTTGPTTTTTDPRQTTTSTTSTTEQPATTSTTAKPKDQRGSG